MAEKVTINRARRLYVIPCGDGFTCLGFDVAERRRVAEWLAGIAIGIAFDYVGIERDANMLHAPHRLTEAQLDRVTGQWFKHMAHQLMRIWDKCGIAVTVG